MAMVIKGIKKYREKEYDPDCRKTTDTVLYLESQFHSIIIIIDLFLWSDKLLASFILSKIKSTENVKYKPTKETRGICLVLST